MRPRKVDFDPETPHVERCSRELATPQVGPDHHLCTSDLELPYGYGLVGHSVRGARIWPRFEPSSALVECLQGTRS